MSKEHKLSTIAKECGMPMKQARAILRKAKYKRPGTRWVFDTAGKAEVKKLLKAGGARKSRAPVAAKKHRPRSRHVEVANGASAM